MIGLLPPPLIFHGRLWSTEVLTGMAAVWWGSLGKEFQPSRRPIAMVMANRPESVALLFALSCFPSPLILLPLDLRPWRSSPPLPADTRLVLLRLFASQEYQCWAGTPMMADVLSRCPVPGRHRAPPVCLIGGHVSADVARRFKERFDVPLRSYYGTTETGSISVDGARGGEVRAGTTGWPVPVSCR